MPNNDLTIVSVSANDLLRKGTQQRMTKNKVTTHATSGGMETLGEKCLVHSLCTAKAQPWSPPQTTKFQLAPCQRPPSNIVRNRFRYVLRTPWRFPPSGMYK